MSRLGQRQERQAQDFHALQVGLQVGNTRADEEGAREAGPQSGLRPLTWLQAVWLYFLPAFEICGLLSLPKERLLLLRLCSEAETTIRIYSAPWRRKWQPTPVFLPGKVHGQRSLAGCSPWGYMTEHVCMRVEGHGLVAINW